MLLCHCTINSQYLWRVFRQQICCWGNIDKAEAITLIYTSPPLEQVHMCSGMGLCLLSPTTWVLGVNLVAALARSSHAVLSWGQSQVTGTVMPSALSLPSVWNPWLLSALAQVKTTSGLGSELWLLLTWGCRWALRGIWWPVWTI